MHWPLLQRGDGRIAFTPAPVANSAACFDFRPHRRQRGNRLEAQDWVCPGIMLYGATPFTHASHSAVSLRLKPAMTVTTEVIGIQSLRPGERVGYGATLAPRNATNGLR